MAGDVENRVEIDAQDRIPIGVAQLAERSASRVMPALMTRMSMW